MRKKANDQSYPGVCAAGHSYRNWHSCIPVCYQQGQVAVDKSRSVCYNVFTVGSCVAGSSGGVILKDCMFSEITGRVLYVALGIAIGINLFLFGVI
jgi:hypothetical protein